MKLASQSAGRVSSERMRNQFPKIDPALSGLVFKTLMDRDLQLAA